MNDQFDSPYKSPVQPQQLTEDSKFCFSCYPGISCFNACCKQADITLAPYDVIRLKQRLGISSSDFLQQHTVPFTIDADGTPGIKMRTTDVDPVCLFLDEETGCSVYEDRPTACRYYPMGLLTSRRSDEYHDEQHFAIVKEKHCQGHFEQRELTVGEYRKEQDVEIYDELNRDFYRIIIKKKSAGPGIGKPSKMSQEFFFMAAYDIDRFKDFLTSKNFRSVYDLTDEEYNTILNDDIERLKFSYRLLKQVLFNEPGVPLKDNALQKRMEERKEVIELRQKAELELAKQKAPFEDYIQD